MSLGVEPRPHFHFPYVYSDDIVQCTLSESEFVKLVVANIFMILYFFPYLRFHFLPFRDLNILDLRLTNPLFLVTIDSDF